MENSKRIVEINGIKVEVDLRTAKRVDTFKVGDAVKILKKKEEYSQAEVFAGVIVGFAEFQTLPTIVVLALKISYSDVNFEFIHINEEQKKYEMIAHSDYEQLFVRSNVVDQLNKKIDTKKLEVHELELKLKYFNENFAKAFEQIPEKKEG